MPIPIQKRDRAGRPQEYRKPDISVDAGKRLLPAKIDEMIVMVKVRLQSRENMKCTHIFSPEAHRAISL